MIAIFLDCFANFAKFFFVIFLRKKQCYGQIFEKKQAVVVSKKRQVFRYFFVRK
jgi:hypothetical protein